MKKVIVLSTLFLAGLSSSGYSQIQQVIAACGGNGEDGNLSLEWTLGEPVVATLTTDDAVLTQGFHQPVLTVTAVKGYKDSGITINAYPNPTSDRLLIKLNNTEIKNFQYVLYDLNGKILEMKKLNGDITTVSMQDYPAGIYLMKVIQPEKEIKTFEIIKH